jgi:hypothetical protein
MPTRRFLNWRGCVDHTPAKLAGHPEPPKPPKFVPNPIFSESTPLPAPVTATRQPNPEDMQPVDRSKAAASSRQETKARIAEAKKQAREAAAAAGAR